MHDSDAHAEDVGFVFRPSDDPDAEARDELSRQFPGATWDEPVRGVLADVGALILTGSISLSVLATTIVRLTCHLRMRGQIIDLRKPDIDIKEDPTRGPGYVIVVGSDGRHELLNVCVEPADLAALLSANRPPAST
ncbi:MAG: hypothetical protein QOD83_1402 [Solirubrobacteraceae bacterium]|nr:hypothetical protein [Solirubrobacteraceae bacterium]